MSHVQGNKDRSIQWTYMCFACSFIGKARALQKYCMDIYRESREREREKEKKRKIQHTLINRERERRRSKIEGGSVVGRLIIIGLLGICEYLFVRHFFPTALPSTAKSNEGGGHHRNRTIHHKSKRVYSLSLLGRFSQPLLYKRCWLTKKSKKGWLVSPQPQIKSHHSSTHARTLTEMVSWSRLVCSNHPRYCCQMNDLGRTQKVANRLLFGWQIISGYIVVHSTQKNFVRVSN